MPPYKLNALVHRLTASWLGFYLSEEFGVAPDFDIGIIGDTNFPLPPTPKVSGSLAGSREGGSGGA